MALASALPVRFPAGRLWPIGLAVAILLGAVLRLAWPQDIEYKGDEQWTFAWTQEFDRTGTFPWLGMPSSVKVHNPGLSVWVFLVLGKLFAVHDPIALTRVIELLSIAAILALVGFAWRVVGPEEREPWLWAAALVAVNPFAVLLHRKIWPPSILPIIALLMLVGWWYRDRRWGAFVWGLVGACLGQINMSGFFYAAGFFLWAVLFDRKRIPWLSWLAGSCLGVVPMLPWLHYLWTGWTDHSLPGSEGTHWPTLWFWLHWFTEPFGIGLEYSLGRDYPDFLRYPLVDGRPTHAVRALHICIIGIGAFLFVRASYLLYKDRPNLGSRWVGRESATAFTINAALWGYGLLLTASRLDFNRHYLAFSFPLEFVWLARLALAGSGATPRLRTLNRSLLLLLFTLELLLTACFLDYIHVNHGAPGGDYGTAYGAQEHLAVPSPSE